jgi:hypothetical protein
VSARRALSVFAALTAVATAACGTLLAIDPDTPGAAAEAGSGGDGSLTGEGGTIDIGDGGIPDDGSLSDGNAADAGPLLVFVSESTTAGDMRFGVAAGPAGRSNADAVCTTEASLAGRVGAFVAWLSTETGNAGDHAIDRLPAGRSRALRSGALVFASKSAIPSGPLVAIVQTAAGTIIDPNGGDLTTVYTGTNNLGQQVANNTCVGWASAGGGVVQAQLGQTDQIASWTVSIMTNCDQPRRIYCFQQQ